MGQKCNAGCVLFPCFLFIFSKKRGRRGSIFILFRLQNGDLILYPNDLGCSASKRKVKVSLQRDGLHPQYRKREEMEENRKRNRLSVNKFSYLTWPEISLNQREGEILGEPNRVRQTELRSCLTPIPPGCNSHHMKLSWK